MRVPGAGGAAKAGGNWMEKKWRQKHAKSMGKFLAGFNINDPDWIMLVTSAFEDIFLNYNLQFITIVQIHRRKIYSNFQIFRKNLNFFSSMVQESLYIQHIFRNYI